MKVQDWVFTVRYSGCDRSLSLGRRSVVGPARASTVEAALHLAGAPEAVRVQIRANEIVRKFVEGALDPEASGYYVHPPCSASDASTSSWVVCIGSIHEVIR